jgi:uncharacterized protein YciI
MSRAARVVDRDSLRVVLFVVLREQGSAWDPARAMREQDYWPDHVEFVNGIPDEVFLLGGPLGELEQDGGAPDPTEPVGPSRRYRALLVMRAESEEELRALLDADPWSIHHLLATAEVYRWEKLVGEILTP